MTDDVNDVGRKAALSIFGDIIRRKRYSCRWTFYALSEKTGIEAAALSALEDGSDAVSDIERETLCEFLGTGIPLRIARGNATMSKWPEVHAVRTMEERSAENHALRCLGANPASLNSSAPSVTGARCARKMTKHSQCGHSPSTAGIQQSITPDGRTGRNM